MPRLAAHACPAAAGSPGAGVSRVQVALMASIHTARVVVRVAQEPEPTAEPATTAASVLATAEVCGMAVGSSVAMAAVRRDLLCWPAAARVVPACAWRLLSMAIAEPMAPLQCGRGEHPCLVVAATLGSGERRRLRWLCDLRCNVSLDLTCRYGMAGLI